MALNIKNSQICQMFLWEQPLQRVLNRENLLRELEVFEILDPVKELLWAIRFLTVIPLGKERDLPPERMGIVMLWYPVVGLLIGLCLLVVYVPLVRGFPIGLADALVLGFYIFLTGALHLDGLADTLDGILGGWNRQRRLEIMKDSRIGSYGVLGLVAVLGLKYLSFHEIGGYVPETPHLDSLPDSLRSLQGSLEVLKSDIAGEGEVWGKGLILIAMPILGRWFQTLAAGLSPYAREEGGTASALVTHTGLKHSLAATVFPLLLIGYFYGGRGLIIISILVVCLLGQVAYIKSRIGGMTGDSLGAVNETSELLFLMLFYVI